MEYSGGFHHGNVHNMDCRNLSVTNRKVVLLVGVLHVRHKKLTVREQNADKHAVCFDVAGWEGHLLESKCSLRRAHFRNNTRAPATSEAHFTEHIQSGL